MEKNVVVVDGFYSAPEQVRSLALSARDWISVNEAGQRKPSVETVKCYYHEGLVRRFEELVGEPIRVDPSRMGFGAFAYYPGGVPVDETTHFDDSEWSAVIYLVPDALCRGGITFYRHRDTDLIGPPDETALRRLGFASLGEFLSQVYYPDKLQPQAWEEVLHVPMRFNRLVLLRGGKLFHRASSGFGDRPENARLTQRFFFEKAEKELDSCARN
jgi:hypothetical protein